MKRVLKKEGRIIISVYSDKALDERLNLYRKLKFKIKEVRKNGAVIFDDPLSEGISEQFSRNQIKEIAGGSVFHSVGYLRKSNFCRQPVTQPIAQLK